MSKYARIIDIEKLLYRKGFCIGKTSDELYEALSDLPTIEVSEDCISKGWLEQEIEDILVESKFEDECLEIRGWNSALDTVVAIIEKAPSVVPSRADTNCTK